MSLTATRASAAAMIAQVAARSTAPSGSASGLLPEHALASRIASAAASLAGIVSVAFLRVFSRCSQRRLSPRPARRRRRRRA
jgi:hypothetical protein